MTTQMMKKIKQNLNLKLQKDKKFKKSKNIILIINYLKH